MDKIISVVGLGYVGLPLALAFGAHRRVIGFDIDVGRVSSLQNGSDATREASKDDFIAAQYLEFSSVVEDISAAQIYIITVPTPVDDDKRPDMSALISASKMVGSVLKAGDIVIYESTVYPGATEEVCVPHLEAASGLVYNKEFFCGYSPERINPGDKAHRLETIVKITSGSTPAIAEEVDVLYQNIITAGTHRASSIAVAEAAKVIENTQRDINIALINELSLIFNRMGLDTLEVLEAAGTKWNFLPFRPGLVGGHCIGVDPYYLTHKAQSLGYHPKMILAGRKINDAMAAHVADETVKEMLRRDLPIKGGRILVLGLTFKEDCPDLRNSKIVDLVKTLTSYGALVDIHDAQADQDEIEDIFGQKALSDLNNVKKSCYEAIILAVPHEQYRSMKIEDVKAFGHNDTVIFDVKATFENGYGILRL